MQYLFDAENHIHTLDGEPLFGTSSMSSVLAKHGLTYWAAGLAVEKFGWTHKGNAKKGWNPKAKRLEKAIKTRETISTLSDEEYLDLLDEGYSAHSKKLKTTAVSGTDMHYLMECYVLHCIEKNGGKPDGEYLTEDKQVKILVAWSLTKVKRFIWSEAHCFSKVLWLGGISDVGFEDLDGKYAILDFKSSKDIFLPQFWQCVGYAIQIEENGLFTPEGELIMKLDKPISYVAVLPFGMSKPEVLYNHDMESGKKACQAMVTLYNLLPR